MKKNVDAKIKSSLIYEDDDDDDASLSFHNHIMACSLLRLLCEQAKERVCVCLYLLDRVGEWYIKSQTTLSNIEKWVYDDAFSPDWLEEIIISLIKVGQ